jgi:hypothetical protein
MEGAAVRVVAVLVAHDRHLCLEKEIARVPAFGRVPPPDDRRDRAGVPQARVAGTDERKRLEGGRPGQRQQGDVVRVELRGPVVLVHLDRLDVVDVLGADLFQVDLAERNRGGPRWDRVAEVGGAVGGGEEEALGYECASAEPAVAPAEVDFEETLGGVLAWACLSAAHDRFRRRALS